MRFTQVALENFKASIWTAALLSLTVEETETITGIKFEEFLDDLGVGFGALLQFENGLMVLFERRDVQRSFLHVHLQKPYAIDNPDYKDTIVSILKDLKLPLETLEILSPPY